MMTWGENVDDLTMGEKVDQISDVMILVFCEKKKKKKKMVTKTRTQKDTHQER